MNITDIPFVKLIGIEEKDKILSLNFKDNVLNHIQTIHAAAQFTLAESKSGIYLQNLFPKYKNKAIPVLRNAIIKYKKPAKQKIVAYASAEEEAIQKFRLQFEDRGRGLLEIKVDIKDINNTLTSQGLFTWFVQKI